MGEAQAIGDRPVFVPAVDHARREGVARPVGARDGARGNGDRAQRKQRPVAAGGDRAFGKMRDGPAHGAEAERVDDSPFHRADFDCAAGAARLAPGERADLEIVDDEEIEMGQARAAEFGEPRRRSRHHLEIGDEADVAGLAQDRNPAVRFIPPALVHRLVRARQSEV